MQLPLPLDTKEEKANFNSHRKVILHQRREPRRSCRRLVKWDFYTAGKGAKAGLLENVSSGGCLLRADEAIELRRWIRVLIKSVEGRLISVAVGRVIRHEDRRETSSHLKEAGLYSFGLEWIYPIDPNLLELAAFKIEKQGSCTSR